MNIPAPAMRVWTRFFNRGQAWFWTKEWQAGEREAQADINAGNVHRFDSAEAAIAELRRPTP